jgi:hypothetical protein
VDLHNHINSQQHKLKQKQNHSQKTMSSKIIIALIAVLALCVGHSVAQLVRSTPSNSERVYDFTVSQNKDSASWTAFGRGWTVRLELSEVVADNMDYFHGTLDGDVNAIVSFALLPGTSLSGMIVTGGNSWWIQAQPLPEHGFSEDENRLGIFMLREAHSHLNAADLPALSDPLIADVDAPVDSATSNVENGNERKRTISSYKVAVHYDQMWATASNNPWSTQANTLGLFNDVNAIYKAAGLGQFTVSYQTQVTNSYTSTTDMLSYYSDTASTTLSAFKDSSFTSHIWLVGTNVGGLSYVGTACNPSTAANRKTSVAGLVSYSRLWTVKTIAHELGHNRGANHQFDGACSSTVTTNCQCSIMSYCFPSASNNPLGAVNVFSSFTVNEMQTAGCY